MISSQSQDLNARNDQGDDGLIALAKSLGLDDRSGGEACQTNTCEPLDAHSDEEFAHLKVYVRLHDDDEVSSSPGVMGAESPISEANTSQAVHQVGRAVGRRLFRTVAFVVITGVLVTAAFAWHFHRDVQKSHMVDAGKLHRAVIDAKSARSDVAPVEMAAKTLDRVPAQDAAPAPASPSTQASAAAASSPDLQQQLEALASDVTVVRNIVERIAAVQEQIAVDMATLQKTGQKALSAPHSPAVPARPRNMRSDVVAQSPPVPVLPAPTRTPAPLR